MREQRGLTYSSKPFQTRHEKDIGGQHHVSAALPPEICGTHCTRSRVRPRAGLNGTENFASIEIRSWTVQPIAQSLYRLSYRDLQGGRCLVQIWREFLVFSPFRKNTRIVKLSHVYCQILSNPVFHVFQCPISHASLTLRRWNFL